MPGGFHGLQRWAGLGSAARAGGEERTRLSWSARSPPQILQFDVPVWTGFYSSNTAAWFAGWMGCDPIILCGMDCYQGEKKYFHPSDREAPSFHYPLDDHIRPWIEDGRKLIPHVERVRAMSGPLTSVCLERMHEDFYKNT